MNSQLLQKYLKADLFKELSLNTMSEEERVSFVEAFGNIVWQRTVIRLMRELPDEKKQKLSEFVAAHEGDAAAVTSFLAADLPILERLLDEEIAGYKKELIKRFQD